MSHCDVRNKYVGGTEALIFLLHKVAVEYSGGSQRVRRSVEDEKMTRGDVGDGLWGKQVKTQTLNILQIDTFFFKVRIS